MRQSDYDLNQALIALLEQLRQTSTLQVKWKVDTDSHPAATMIRLLLADDQELFRQGLATMLSVEPDLKIVGHVTNGQEAIAAVKTLPPQVIFMDVRMPICEGVQALWMCQKIAKPRFNSD